jgi:hypothetical protein
VLLREARRAQSITSHILALHHQEQTDNTAGIDGANA